MDWLRSISFKSASNYIQSAHEFVISLLMVLATYIMPLVPAWFVSQSIVENLEFPASWARYVAFALEVVGIGVLHLAVRTTIAWYRRTHTHENAFDVPVWVPLTFASVYVINLMLLAVVLDVVPTQYERVPIALLCVMAVVSAGVYGVRSAVHEQIEQQEDDKTWQRKLATEDRHWEHEIELEKLRLRHEEKLAKLSNGTVSRPSQGTVSRDGEDGTPLEGEERQKRIMEHIEKHGDTGPSDIAKAVGVGRSTVYRDLEEMEGRGDLVRVPTSQPRREFEYALPNVQPVSYVNGAAHG